MTTALFVLLVVAHFYDSPQTASTSWGVMWKWCVLVHQMSWMWETVITIIYWGLLFDNDLVTLFDWWDDLSIHAFPLLCITLDWAMNGMQYEFKTIWIDVGSILLYGIVNFVATKTTGEPIYEEVISWESWISLVIVLGLTVVFAGIFIGEYYLTRWKIRKLGFYGYGSIGTAGDGEGLALVDEGTEIIVVLMKED